MKGGTEVLDEAPRTRDAWRIAESTKGSTVASAEVVSADMAVCDPCDDRLRYAGTILVNVTIGVLVVRSPG